MLCESYAEGWIHWFGENMTTPYQKGVRVENLLANELRARGWTVLRGAGSKGPADLVAWKEPRVRFIQVKRCRSVSGLRRAVCDAIDKFEQGDAWFDSAVAFEITLRYQRYWVTVWRSCEVWKCARWAESLLGQSEWPSNRREA